MSPDVPVLLIAAGSCRAVARPAVTALVRAWSAATRICLLSVASGFTRGYSISTASVQVKTRIRTISMGAPSRIRTCAHGSGGRPRDRTNLGADLRRLHEWWRRQRRSFRACSGSPFVRAGLVSDHRVGRFPSGIYAVTVERISDGFLSWRPLIAGDLPMLAEWLREPQVARWWNHETTLEAVERDFGASTRGEEPGEDLLVLLDGRPIGLLQRSAICDYPQDLTEFSAVIEVPVGAVELDYLIADPALRGRGLGSRMIAAAVEDTWNSYSDAPAVLVAVVAANVASWRALEKAGLKRVAEGPMSPDNPIDDALHYIYRADRPGAASSAFRR